MNSSSCKGETIHLVFIPLIFVSGVLSNGLLIYAAYKTWKQRKSPDKVCILNFALSNITVIVVALPLRLVYLVGYENYLMCGIIRKVHQMEELFWVLCVFVSVSTLAVIGFDRYEALTKFQYQRTLTVMKSVFVMCILWAFSLLVAIVFYITFPSVCRIYALKLTPLKTRGATRIIKEAVIVSWVGISCQRCAKYLILASKTIRKHREQINNTLGHRLADIEVSFTKNVITFCVSNVIFAVPLALLSIVTRFFRGDINIRCAAQWIDTILYLSFVNAPIIYFYVDKRMREQLRIRKIKIQETHSPKQPSSQGFPPGVTDTQNTFQLAINIISTENK